VVSFLLQKSETSVFSLKQLATKNIKLDQSLHRTNFSSGNQKSMNSQFWWVKKAASLVWLCLAKNCHNVGYTDTNQIPVLWPVMIHHIHHKKYTCKYGASLTLWSTFMCKTPLCNWRKHSESFGFGVLILATVRIRVSTMMIRALLHFEVITKDPCFISIQADSLVRNQYTWVSAAKEQTYHCH
jgi:hypothetical protein